MIRAFIGLELPETVRFQLSLIQPRLLLPHMTDPEDFHLTLAFLGDQPEPALEDLHFALQGLRLAPFSLRLQGTGIFGGDKPRVVWAGVAPDPALEALQAKVATCARRMGLAPESGRFVPHVTLARSRGKPTPEDLARLSAGLQATAGFATAPFHVTEFALFSSNPGRKGPRYDVLMRYPLTG